MINYRLSIKYNQSTYYQTNELDHYKDLEKCTPIFSPLLHMAASFFLGPASQKKRMRLCNSNLLLIALGSSTRTLFVTQITEPIPDTQN